MDELGADHLGRFNAERARRPVRVPTVLSDPAGPSPACRDAAGRDANKLVDREAKDKVMIEDDVKDSEKRCRT